MTKLEFTLREFGELYEFAKAIRPYRIPRKPKKQAEAEKKSTTPAPHERKEPETPFIALIVHSVVACDNPDACNR